MSILNQKTLAKNISFTGIGIHSGRKAKIKILPAKPNTGILFKRTDIKENNLIHANYINVADTRLCTTISNESGVSVSTIEHLMGAFYALGIDNALIEIDSEEVPILDGSAKEFVQLINSIGTVISDQPIKVIKINKNIKIYDEEKFISMEKSNVTSEIEFEIKYQNKLIGVQKNKVNVFEDDLNHILNSRTFCLFEDIEKLKKLNLGKGGNLNNAIVVKDNKVLNENGLRNDLEFVNHKILDCMGDLYLVGYRLIGSVSCRNGGHSLTNKLLRKVFSDNRNYSLIEIKGKNLPHPLINNRYYLKSIA